jgi:hypothetical protein
VPLIIGYYLKDPQRQQPGADQPPVAGSPENQPAQPIAERSPDTF